MRLGTIVAVVWQDAATDNEWRSLKEHGLSKGCLVVSMGVVVQWNKQVVSLAPTISVGDGEGADVITIPRSLIRAVKRLK